MRHNQSTESILAGFSLLLKMTEQLSADNFTEFIDSLTSIVERTKHTRMLIASHYRKDGPNAPQSENFYRISTERFFQTS